jgi:glycosyltransferase involved in cell wall biosynthesis
LREALATVKITRPILWISRPEQRFIVGHANEMLSIYHVVDEYSGYTDLSVDKQRRLQKEEARLLAAVDAVVVVSPELQQSKTVSGREPYVVENAVDFERFSEVADRPSDMAKLSGPIFGYSGLIGRRLNISLILKLAKMEPGWAIVLLGKVDPRGCEREIELMRSQENIHMLGQKAVTEVANYVANFDVGLLPYELDLETENISPLKMYEYLAVGIPVISTPIPAALRSADVVSIAGSDAEFASLCRAALQADDEYQRKTRIEFARSNTWEKRVDQLSEIIGSHLKASNHV